VRCYTIADVGYNWQNFLVNEIHVVPASTPNPNVTIANLNNDNCDAHVVAALPAFSDAGTLKLELSNEFGAFSFTLRNYAAAELIDLTFSSLDVSTLGGDANVIGQTPLPDSDSNFCNTRTVATISYQHLGAPVAYGWAITTPTQLNTRPSVVVTTNNDASCSIHVVASYPSIQQGAQVHFYLATDTFGYDAYFTGVHSGQVFVADIPLMDQTAFAALENLDHFTTWGEAPSCEAQWWIVSSNTNDAYGSQVTSSVQVMPVLPEVPAVVCAPGTYSNTGAAPCADAAPGYFVDKSGATEATACGLGFYSDTSNSVGCTPAAKGWFVASTAANSSIACGAGKNTRMTAARSAFECYTLRVQTVKAVKVLKTYKYGTKVITPTLTDGGRALTASAVGKCTVAVTKVTVKVKGKSTRVNRYQIVAAKSAGNCSVTYTNAGDEDFASLRVVKTFKVSKTGK